MHHVTSSAEDLIIIISVGLATRITNMLDFPWVGGVVVTVIYELKGHTLPLLPRCGVESFTNRLGKQSVSLYILATRLRPMSKKKGRREARKANVVASWTCEKKEHLCMEGRTATTHSKYRES